MGDGRYKRPPHPPALGGFLFDILKFEVGHRSFEEVWVVGSGCYNGPCTPRRVFRPALSPGALVLYIATPACRRRRSPRIPPAEAALGWLRTFFLSCFLSCLRLEAPLAF